MTRREQAPESERLSEEAARRLLARASELEAAGDTELSVAELREAAREAGIASAAFEQALAERRSRDPAAAAGLAPTGLRRVARFWPAALIIVVLLSYVFLRLFPAA